MLSSLTRKLIFELTTAKEYHYILEIYLHDEKAERTVTSYLNHIAKPVILNSKTTVSNGSLLIYDIVLPQQDTEFMQNLLTIKGVSKASLTKRE